MPVATDNLPSACEPTSIEFAFANASSVSSGPLRVIHKRLVCRPMQKAIMRGGGKSATIVVSSAAGQRNPVSIARLGVAAGLAFSLSLGHIAAAHPLPISTLSSNISTAIMETLPNLKTGPDLPMSVNIRRYSEGAKESSEDYSSAAISDTVETGPSTFLSSSSSSLVRTEDISDDKGKHKSLGERLADKLRKQDVPDELVVFLLSAMPVVELRAGVPIGFVLGLHPLKVFALAVLGNIAPIIPLMLLLRIRVVQTLAAKVLDRARRKAASVGTAGSRAMALALFVGVPLPGTGAWTGSVVAFVLGMPIGRTILSLLAGVVMAASIMTVLCALGKVGAAFAGAVLLGVGVSSMLRVDSRQDTKEDEQGSAPLVDGSIERS